MSNIGLITSTASNYEHSFITVKYESDSFNNYLDAVYLSAF